MGAVTHSDGANSYNYALGVEEGKTRKWEVGKKRGERAPNTVWARRRLRTRHSLAGVGASDGALRFGRGHRGVQRCTVAAPLP